MSRAQTSAAYLQRIAPAVFVHLYTGIGCVLGFCSLAAVCRGDMESAFLLLAGATWIDYTDGTLARHYKVWDLLPQIDGALLDRVVDFLVVVVLPVLILVRSGLLPTPRLGWVVIIIGVALFRFARTFDPWIKDGFSWGLPSFWLFPVFYIIGLRPGQLASGILLGTVAVLGCMPVGHIHPALFPRLKLFNVVGLVGWWAVYLLVTQELVRKPRWWVIASMAYPLAYVVSSWRFFFVFKFSKTNRVSGNHG